MLLKVRGLTRGRVERVGWTGLMLVTAACRDHELLMSPASVNRTKAQEISVVDSSDFFAADVTVAASGGEGAAGVPEQRREFRYHVERTLNGKAWKTTMTIGPSGLGAGQRGPADIARVEIDDETQSARMYRRDGTEVPMADTEHPAVASMAHRYGSDATLAQLRPTRGRKDNPAHSASPRAWLDGLVVPASDEHRGRRVGQLEGQFGKAKGKVDNLDRYAKSDGHRTVEVLVDPGAGTVTESNVAQDGRLVQHARYDYAELPGRGVRVRQSTHMEIAPQGGTGKPTVIDYTLSNVRLERRGGTP